MGGSSFTVIMNPMRREGLEGTVTSDQRPRVKPLFTGWWHSPPQNSLSLQTPITTLGVPQLLSLLTNWPYIHSDDTELREALYLPLQFYYRTRIQIRASQRERHIRLAWENPRLRVSIVPSPRVRTWLSCSCVAIYRVLPASKTCLSSGAESFYWGFIMYALLIKSLTTRLNSISSPSPLPTCWSDICWLNAPSLWWYGWTLWLDQLPSWIISLTKTV